MSQNNGTAPNFADLGGRYRHAEREESPKGEKPKAARFKWEPIDAETLDNGDFRPEYLIKGAMVARQPAAVVGGSKTLKTTIGLDAGISIASGTAFLDEFAVPCPHKVAFLSAESGQFTIQETARRICTSRGIALASLKDTLSFQFSLPQLALANELKALAEGIEKDKVEVIFCDPLYLALLAGSEGIEASNMFQMGPLLLNIASTCLSLGCTPILLHHTNRPGARKFEPLELSDIAYSGVPEFARQWWLLSRREPYQPGSGKHHLYLSAGGSVGHGGLWHLDIEEGQLADDFTGRTWDVTVSGATVARKAAADDREKKRHDQMQADDNAVAGCIDGINANKKDKQGTTQRRVRGLTGLSAARVAGACERLLAAGLFTCGPKTFKRKGGKPYTADVYRRAKDQGDS